MNILPTARTTADSAVADVSDTGIAFLKTIMDALMVAIAANLRTTTISFSGITGPNFYHYLAELNQKGYGTSVASTNLTITW